MMRRIWNRARKDQRGFTLIELLAVVAILGILAAFAVPKIVDAIDKAKVSRGKSDLAVIASAIDRFYVDKGYYPEKLNDLISEKYLKNHQFKNGYGNVYFYAVPIVTSNSDRDAFVLGDPGESPKPLTGTGAWNSESMTSGSGLPAGLAPDQPAYTWGTGGTLGDFDTAVGSLTNKPTHVDLITD